MKGPAEREPHAREHATEDSPADRHEHGHGHGHGDGHGHGHDDHHDTGAPHATVKGYVTGFVLSVILTAIPFWLVMAKVFPDVNTTTLVILALGAVQIVVHMIYFLHMNSKSEGGWTMLALIFTAVLLVIMLSGSLWIMYHLNNNMMPMSAEQMRHVP